MRTADPSPKYKKNIAKNPNNNINVHKMKDKKTWNN